MVTMLSSTVGLDGPKCPHCGRVRVVGPSAFDPHGLWRCSDCADGKLGPIRPAASPEQLAKYAKVIGQWLAVLDGEGGCALCGVGPHVPRCPVPALLEATELLAFMASVPVESVPRTRGVAS